MLASRTSYQCKSFMKNAAVERLLALHFGISRVLTDPPTSYSYIRYVSGLDRFPGSLPEWVELQRRYSMMMPPGGQPPGSMPMHGAPHIPGVYPPASLANDLLQRERERLERLGTSKTEDFIFAQCFDMTLPQVTGDFGVTDVSYIIM